MDAKLTWINAVYGYLPASAFSAKAFHTIDFHFQNHIIFTQSISEKTGTGTSNQLLGDNLRFSFR